MLPFLKKRDDGVGVGPAEKVRREPDKPDDYDLVDAVVDDFAAAFDSKVDKPRLKAAINSLIDHIMDIDSTQDQELTGKSNDYQFV